MGRIAAVRARLCARPAPVAEGLACIRVDRNRFCPVDRRACSVTATLLQLRVVVQDEPHEAVVNEWVEPACGAGSVVRHGEPTQEHVRNVAGLFAARSPECARCADGGGRAGTRIQFHHARAKAHHDRHGAPDRRGWRRGCTARGGGRGLVMRRAARGQAESGDKRRDEGTHEHPTLDRNRRFRGPQHAAQNARSANRSPARSRAQNIARQSGRSGACWLRRRTGRR